MEVSLQLPYFALQTHPLVEKIRTTSPPRTQARPSSSTKAPTQAWTPPRALRWALWTTHNPGPRANLPPQVNTRPTERDMPSNWKSNLAAAEEYGTPIPELKLPWIRWYLLTPSRLRLWMSRIRVRCLGRQQAMVVTIVGIHSAVRLARVCCLGHRATRCCRNRLSL